MTIVTISAARYRAEIATLGAELRRLTDAEGRDLLWDGDPAVWKGRAPILFPIVGALAAGQYRLDGDSYSLGKHGFARDSEFALVSVQEDQALFRLLPDARTRATYPFEFRFDIAFGLTGDGLEITATVANEGDCPMPASFGFHPAFRWPLPDGGERGDHLIRFAAAEPDPIRRIDRDGLMTSALHPTPIEGTDLKLRDDLFTDDAMILPAPSSRSLRYGAPGFAALQIAWENLPSLGIWTKPGAGYVCIEPWQGHADPEGFDGDIRDKPGIVLIEPGEDRKFRMKVTVAASF
jgi:galactose mutarotase-like enzyme